MTGTTADARDAGYADVEVCKERFCAILTPPENGRGKAVDVAVIFACVCLISVSGPQVVVVE